MVWVPGVKPESLGSSSVARIPSREEFHSHPVMVPSSSVPEPSKVTISFLNLADEGVIESMVATGSRLGVAVSRAVSRSDHSPFSSCTRKEIVCSPLLKPVTLSSASLPRSPSRDEVHS